MRGACFFLLFLFSLPCLAQNAGKEALLQQLAANRAQASSKDNLLKRAQLFNKLASLTLFTETPASLAYADSAIQLSEKLGDKDSRAEACYLAGRASLLLNDNVRSMKSFLDARSLAEQTGNQHWIGQSNFYIGLLMSGSGNQEGAREAYQRALVAAKLSKDSLTLAYTYGNLVYMSPYEEGERYGIEGIRIVEKLGDARQLVVQRNTLAGLYITHDQSEKALPYMIKNLGYLKTTRDSSLFVDIMSIMGHVYARMGDTLSAIKFYLLSLSRKHLINDPGVLFPIYEHLPYMLYETGDYRQAASVFIDYINAINEYKRNETAIQVNQLSMQENFRRKQYADSVNTVKEREVSRLKLKQQKLYSFAGLALVLMLALILFVIYRNFRTQKKLTAIIQDEKHKSDELLLNILPSDVADELKAKGASDARQFDEVSVLFTDFANFTLVAEKLGPQRLVDELHVCFSAFDRIMEKYGLEKIKTIGDAYLAVAGLPQAMPDHAARSVMAAKDILAFMNSRKAMMGDDTFGIRIGIHSGSVVGGIVGIKKFAYDIWGDTVNTAARMEQHSEPGRINISEETYKRVRDQFICHSRGMLPAKNKGVLPMYYVE